MGFPNCILELHPAQLWWVWALLAPCLAALIPAGNPQKGGRP